MCASTPEPSAVPSLRPSFVTDCDNRNVLDFTYQRLFSRTCDDMRSDGTDPEYVQDCQEVAPFAVGSVDEVVSIRFNFSPGGAEEVQTVRADSFSPIIYRLEVPPGSTRIEVTWPVVPGVSDGVQRFFIVIPAGDLSLIDLADAEFLGPFRFVSVGCVWCDGRSRRRRRRRRRE